MDFEKDIENLFNNINKVNNTLDRNVLLSQYRNSCSIIDDYFRRYLNHVRYDLSYIEESYSINMIKLCTIENLTRIIRLLETNFNKQEKCSNFNDFNHNHIDVNRMNKILNTTWTIWEGK